MVSWLWSFHALSEFTRLWRASSVSEMQKSCFHTNFNSKFPNVYFNSRSHTNNSAPIFWQVSLSLNKHGIREHKSHHTKLNNRVFLRGKTLNFRVNSPIFIFNLYVYLRHTLLHNINHVGFLTHVTTSHSLVPRALDLNL